MNGNLQEKYNKLLNILRSTGGLAVAFSGGVDSAFLVYAAHEALGGKLLAITAVTQSYPRHEAADAARILAQYRAFAKTVRSAAITANTHFLQKLKKQRKSMASALWLTAPIPMTKAITAPACALRLNLAF